METHVALAAEKLFQIGPIPVTNSLLTTWIVTIILIAFAFFATRNASLIPHKLQNIAESMIETLADLITTIAPDKTKVFLPIIASFFFFILFGNYLGLLPGVGTIGFYEDLKEEVKGAAFSSEKEFREALQKSQSPQYATPAAETDTTQNPTTVNSKPLTLNQKTFVPYFRSINSDLNTTAALAIVSLLATHYLAIRYLGIWHYLMKFISLNPIFLFVGILELIGEATKILSLSFRLFGNIFAGEVLLTTASTKLFAFIVPIPFYFLEILVGFVQALIFAMLTLVFLTILTSKQGH